ncbi:MAG TPA: hypothetical protein PLA73_09020, partial [Sedimentibacter sp.]|nr:hypothetical protein [Sedimentibacter sp.]
KVRTFIRNDEKRELFNSYGTSVSTFLVFCAVYHYGGGAYWPYVEEYIGKLENIERGYIYNRFLRILEQYGLPKFGKEREEGYKYITPIICHAGIPQSCYDDYFDVVNDTLSNTVFFEGHIIDEFKYFIRFKVQKPVIRYFNFLGNDAEDFLQRSRDLLLYCDDANSSLEEAIVKFDDLPKRMIERCFFWLSNEKVKEKIKTRKNVLLTNPKIMLDPRGFGVYAILPQQLIKESFEDSVSWEISYSDTSYTTKARLYKRGEHFVSEEKTITLLPSETYKFSVYVEDKPAGTWEYRGLCDGYMCFDKSGNLIKKSYLPPDIVVIVFKKNYDMNKNLVIAEELPYLPNWTNHKLYRVNLQSAEQLYCSFGTIEVRGDNRPVLRGGKELFEIEDVSGSNIYTVLPDILFTGSKTDDWHIIVASKHEKKELNVVRDTIPSGVERVSLSKYITRYAFGEYDITVWNSRENQGRYLIKYVPGIEFSYDYKSFWPSGTKGYLNNEFYFRFPHGVKLTFENATSIGYANVDGRDYNKYVFNNIGRSLIGSVNFTSGGYDYKVPVKKSIRPIMWGFMGIGTDTSITWSSSFRTFSINDIKNYSDPSIIFSIEECGYESVRLKLILYSNNMNPVNTRIAVVQNNSNFRFALGAFLSDILVLEESSFNLMLEVFTLDGNKICECLIAKIQEDIIYSDLSIYLDDKYAYFRWNEQGAKTDREIVLYNCFMPWTSPVALSLENKICEYKMELSMLINSMYAVKIRNVDNFSFFSSEIDLPKIVKMKGFIGGLLQDGQDGFGNFLCGIFRTIYMNKDYLDLDKAFKDFKADITRDNIEALSVSYLFYKKNSVRDKDMRQKADNVFKRLLRMFAQERYKVLKTLLNMELKREDFIKLALEYGMLVIQISNADALTPVEREKLWN